MSSNNTKKYNLNEAQKLKINVYDLS